MTTLNVNDVNSWIRKICGREKKVREQGLMKCFASMQLVLEELRTLHALLKVVLPAFNSRTNDPFASPSIEKNSHAVLQAFGSFKSHNNRFCTSLPRVVQAEEVFAEMVTSTTADEAVMKLHRPNMAKVWDVEVSQANHGAVATSLLQSFLLYLCGPRKTALADIEKDTSGRIRKRFRDAFQAVPKAELWFHANKPMQKFDLVMRRLVLPETLDAENVEVVESYNTLLKLVEEDKFVCQFGASPIFDHLLADARSLTASKATCDTLVQELRTCLKDLKNLHEADDALKSEPSTEQLERYERKATEANEMLKKAGLNWGNAVKESTYVS